LAARHFIPKHSRGKDLRRASPFSSFSFFELYALIVQCHRRLGQKPEALAACQAGRGHYPDDAELLFDEAILRRELGDPAGAEACLLRLLGGREAAHFGSIDTGVRGYKARHNLAVLYQEQKRFPEAEAQWQAAVAERDDFLAGWLGLAEVYLAQQRWPDLEAAMRRVAALPEGGMEAAVLRARGHLARREFGPAREILEASIAAYPRALWPRVIRSHVLLQGRQDWEAAEQALLAILVIDPHHTEAQRNLAVLRRQRGRAAG
jgi:tetratricopeptide (TPR) repeat protein